MRKTFIILLLTCVSLCVSAEPIIPITTLSGRVTDAVDGEPLIGVTIQITELSLATMTDIDGRYVFENLPKRASPSK